MKKKDKLDKTIEELQEKWQDIKPVSTVANIIESQPTEVFHNISEEKELVSMLDEPIQQIGMKDTYLPFVLVKLKICGSNTESRKMIFEGKVKVNNKVVPPNQGQITKSLSNFLLEVNGKKWEIFKI